MDDGANAMAHLNVRERRVEATIAYLGAPRAGKTTNLEHLGPGRAVGPDLVAVDWAPPSGPLASRFRDCEVAVKIVAPRGELEEDRVRALVQGADGIVFVADAGSDARERNEQALSIVRAVLAADGRSDLPFVVQVNKTDLDAALSVDEVVAALDLSSCPRVPASALRGEGVVETAERALGAVLDAMQAGGEESTRPKTDGNPLLTALKQLLRETVDQHVAAYEARNGTATLHREMMDELARTRTSIDAIAARVQELTRAHELRVKAEKEQSSAASATFKRSFDAMSAELKAMDPRAALGELRTSVQLALEKTDELGVTLQPVPSAVRALAPCLTEVEGSLQREIRTVNARAVGAMNDRLDLWRVEAAEAYEKSEARDAATNGLLTELIEELKKPKKGWFG